MTEDVPDDHYRITYDEIHLLIATTAKQILSIFSPDLLIAIGGGGFYPARVLRTFLKRQGANGRMVNVPIQAIGLSLYEDLGHEEKAKESSGPSSIGKIGTTVIRTQWLDAPKRDGFMKGGLLGKNILIVDEVDDSRSTLRYAYKELLSDVKSELAALSPEERAKTPPTRFAIFVVNNKIRSKKGSLPIIWSNHSQTEIDQPEDAEVPRGDKLSAGQEKVADRKDKNGDVVAGLWYFAAETTENCWIEYPWEQEDILEHNSVAALAKRLGKNKGRIEV